MNKENIKVHILGCWGAFPKAGDACSGVLIQADGKNYVFDIGFGVFSKLREKIEIRDIEAVFISHLHYDHMGDAAALEYHSNYLSRTGQLKKKIDIYAPPSPQDLHRQVEYPFVNTCAVEEGFSYQGGAVTIEAIPVSHTVECYAYCIKAFGKKIVYYTDTVFREQDIAFIKDADLFICEATITEGSKHTIGAGHMSDYEAGKLAALSNAKRLCLYHLPGDIDIKQIYEHAKTEYGGELYLSAETREYMI